MKTLYNEGRVVGLSAYSLYVRQVLSRNPDAHVLTESEWLAAALGTNNSMILKISEGTTAGYHDYVLPEGSDLCACTFVLGTVFEGAIATGDDGLWAKRVDDYGRLIANDGTTFPVAPGEPQNVPVKPDYMTPSEEFTQQCREYMKISAGIMLQPGDWRNNIYQTELLDEYGINITTEDDQPLLADLSDSGTFKTLDVDLSRRGFVRILFDEAVEHDFYIFLHGFAFKNILAGMSGFEDLVNADNPENGDFLGPQAFPWAVQITFTYTNDMLSTIRSSVNHMEELYEQISGTIEYWQQSMEDLVTMYGQLNSKYDELESDFGTVEGDVTELNGRVETMETTVRGIDSRFQEVNDSIADTNGRIGEDEVIINTLTGDVRAVENDVDSLSDRMDSVEIRVDDFEDILNTTSETLNGRIDGIDTKIGDFAYFELGDKTPASVVEAIGKLSKLTATIKPATPNVVDAINNTYSKCKNN